MKFFFHNIYNLHVSRPHDKIKLLRLLMFFSYLSIIDRREIEFHKCMQELSEQYIHIIVRNSLSTGVQKR